MIHINARGPLLHPEIWQRKRITHRSRVGCRWADPVRARQGNGPHDYPPPPPGEPPLPDCQPVSRDIANRLLQALPAAVLDALLPRMEMVELARGQVLAELGAPVEHVYFVNRGLVSLLRTMRDGRSADVATVGIEGMADPCILLGLDHSILDAIVHVPGEAYRLPRRQLLTLLEQHPDAKAVLERYMQWLVEQMAQTAACNRLHGLEQRCARWLLTAHDSARGDRFVLTQDFLALMLGARRSSVAEITAAFRDAGHINYRAGQMHILHRESLRRAACECYMSIRRQLAAILP